jgi:hypothetical protein
MYDAIADLRARLAEARTDKKFADMLGEVRIGFANIEGKGGTLEGRVGGKIERSTVSLARWKAGCRPWNRRPPASSRRSYSPAWRSPR